jgi:hypothetical protein
MRPSRTTKIVLASMVPVTLLVGCVAGGLWLMSQACGEYWSSEALSPDGHYIARVAVDSCGATTPAVTRIFVVDTARRDIPQVWRQRQIEIFQTIYYVDEFQFTMRWDDERELVIEYPDRARERITKQRSRAWEVTVIYTSSTSQRNLIFDAD